MDNISWQEFHLVRERLAEETLMALPVCLQLGSGISRFTVAAPVASWQVGPPVAPAEALLVEPLLGSQARLLLLNLTPRELRVNDVVAPPLAVLHELDQFRFDHGPAWQVLLYNRPRIGPLGAGADSKQCAVCLQNLATEARCYCCPCGAVMHLEDESQKKEALLCALTVNECLRCNRALVLQEGYAGGQPSFDCD